MLKNEMMRRFSNSIFGTVIIGLCTGCTAFEAHWDTVSMREHAADYYTDEIMDNLVRARKGLLFVHVDILNMNAAVTARLPATVGAGVTRTHSATALLSNVVRPFNFSLSPENDNALTINTTPVVGDGDVYRPYIRFLNLKRSDERLGHAPSDCVNFKAVVSVQKTDQKPSSGFVEGTLKKGQDGSYYYVPEEFRRAYSELCLALMARDTDAKSDGKKQKNGAKDQKQQKANSKQLKINGSKLDNIEIQQNLQTR